MKKNILKRDLKRNKIITIALIVFIAVSSMLSAAAASLGHRLTKSMSEFFHLAQTAHMIQMHTGDLDERLIDEFVEKHEYIEKYQVVNLLNVKGDSLLLRNDGSTEMGSITDNSFVVQNDEFDFILGQNNEIIKLSSGEVAVPVYYALAYDLSIGNQIGVKTNSGIITFKIVDFGRDSQMNSSFISSKRMVVTKSDWDMLAKETGSLEYIIEFRTTDEKKVDRLEVDYKNANLPSNGPTVTYESIKLLNSLNDIMMLLILIMMSLLMIFISVLCIRFTMITCMDEDYMEIGVMKSIGIPSKYIRSRYFIKYIVISLVGCGIGYLASFAIEGTLQANLNAYMGLVEKDYVNYAFQLLASIISGIIVLFLCSRVMKRIDRISAVEALQERSSDNSDKLVKKPSIFKERNKSVNINLGFKYIGTYKKPYILMTLIFILLTFLMILPLNLTTTIGSSDFVSYMGISKCDLRVDLQNLESLPQEIKQIEKLLNEDKDLVNYALFTTYAATAKSAEGEDVYINFETGDFTNFKINYFEGSEPKRLNELGISYLAAKQLDKEVGDQIAMTIGPKTYHFIISGIYQDITNGGKGAKSIYSPEEKDMALAVFNINIKDEVNKTDKKKIYSQLFAEAKVTDIEDYVEQSMGDAIKQLRKVTSTMILVGIFIIVFTAVIFIKLLMIRDKNDLIVMKRIGFKDKDIRVQYRVRLLTPLLIGIVTGAILVNTLGQSLVSLLIGSMGAPKVVFISNIFYAYILCPLIMIVTIVVTVTFATNKIKIIK